VNERLKLHNVYSDHVMIRSELQYLIGVKVGNLKCWVVGVKTGPFPKVRVFRVVRPVATVLVQVEPYPDPTRESGPVANTGTMSCVSTLWNSPRAALLKAAIFVYSAKRNSLEWAMEIVEKSPLSRMLSL
jgi:hypothetical protein